MPVGSFVSTGRSLPEAIERVQLAEQLGYASAYVTHINGRDAPAGLHGLRAADRAHPRRHGVVPIYSRTPATMAQEAATIDDASGGRMMLGIGVSHRPVVEAWHGQSIDKPVSEMREYTNIVRAILRGEPPPPGDKWTSHFQLGGLGPFPDLPIGVAALSPNMLRLAGEIGDARDPLALQPELHPRRRRSRACARGARRRQDDGGLRRDRRRPSAATDDVAAAYAAMRRDLLPYFGLPFYRAMLERSGFEADIAAYDAVAGDPAAMGAAISDDFLATLTAVGDAGAVRAGIQRYLDAGATSPCLGPIAKTDFEATLRAGAPGRLTMRDDRPRSSRRRCSIASWQRFAGDHPRSRELFERARGSLIGGVPMPWMMRWAGGHPVFAAHAEGARVTDVDGHEYIDFALGDTGAMAGHSPPPTVAATAQPGGAGHHDDAADRGRDLGRRGADAALRPAALAVHADRHRRQPHGAAAGAPADRRPKVLVYSYCYHGSVDETFAVEQRRADGRARGQRRRAGPARRDDGRGRVQRPRRARAGARDARGRRRPRRAGDDEHGDRPARRRATSTALRELTRKHGTLLIIDETHTFSAGPGGCTQAWGLDPDILVIGKAIGGGVPSGALGLTADLAERLFADPEADYEDTGGVGGTLAGNALSSARDARDARAHAARRGVRAHDPARDAASPQGVQGVIDAHERAVERDPARLPRRVPVPARAGARRHRRLRLARRRPRALPAPPRAEPRRDDHAVPQHGADVPADAPPPTSTATPRSSARRSPSSCGAGRAVSRSRTLSLCSGNP